MVLFKETNLVASFEKRANNVEFHQVISYFEKCFLAHSLTHQPVMCEKLLRIFWSTASVEDGVLAGEVDERHTKVEISRGSFCRALKMKDKGEFAEKPTDDDLRSMLKDMGYRGTLKKLGSITRKEMHRIWSFFFDVLNKVFAAKIGGTDQISKHILFIAYAIIRDVNLDIGTRIFEELRSKIGKSEIVFFPRFLSMAIRRQMKKSCAYPTNCDKVLIHYIHRRIFVILRAKDKQSRPHYVQLPKHMIKTSKKRLKGMDSEPTSVFPTLGKQGAKKRKQPSSCDPPPISVSKRPKSSRTHKPTSADQQSADEPQKPDALHTVEDPRQRKIPQYFEDVGKKRKKTVNNDIEPAASKPVMEEVANGGACGVPADNGSRSSLADSFRSAAGSLHDVLKTNLSNVLKSSEEIEKFNSEWDEKWLLLMNDYNVDMAVIRTVYSNPSLRSEKLKLVEKEFTNKLEEHERMRNIDLKELKPTQMADNCNSNVGSDKENTKSLELVGDRIEDQPNRGGNSSNDASNIESTSSHTSEKQMVDATVSSVPTEEIPSQQHEGVHKDLGQVDSVGMEIPLVECKKENDGGTFSPDALHTVEDQHEIDPDNGAIHVDSVVSGEPNGDCNKENTEGSTRNPDGSRVVEDQNQPGGSRTSSSSNSPSAAASQEKTPSVRQIVSPAIDHSVPTVLESENERVQLQPCNGIQDNEGQHNPSSLAEVDIDNLQSLDSGQVGQFNLENSSLELPEAPSIPFSTNPSAAGDQSEILPANGVHSADSVHHQPSDELPNSSQNPGQHPQVAENTAGIPNPAALPYEPNLLNFQGPSNHNQVASWMPNQPLSSSYLLQAEMGRLCELKDNVIKFHEDTKLTLKFECEKELAEMIAQINCKYEAKHQDAEAAFQSKTKELDINLRRVVMNKILAEAFWSTCQDLALPGHAGMQQVSQAGSLQQLHRFSTQPSLQRSPAAVSSSGSQQISTPQIVHQPAALFSTRPPPVARPITPSTTSARPPPTITPYSLSNRPSPDINHPTTPSTRPPPITATRPPNRPPPTINSITPSASNLPRSGEIRAPAPHIQPPQPPSPPPAVAPQASSQPPSPQPPKRSPLPPALSRLPSTRASSLAAQPPPPSSSRLPSLPQMPPSQPLFPFPAEHHPPTTFPAASSSLPQIPPVSTTTHTGLYASAMPENRGVPPLPTSGNLTSLDLVGDVNNQPNLSSNVNFVDLTEVRVHSSSAHDVVCLSDDD